MRARDLGFPRRPETWVPQVSVLLLLMALTLAVLVPTFALGQSQPVDTTGLDRLLAACRSSALGGPLAMAGFAAASALFGWATISLLKLSIRGLRGLRSARAAGSAYRRLSEEVEVCAAGRPIEVCLLDVPARVAFTAGLVRPRIYVSRNVFTQLSRKEVEAVLLHEDSHRRWRDPLVCWLMEMVGTSVWWPGIRTVAGQFRVAREAAADSAAVRAMGDSRPLLSALQRVDAFDRSVLVACGLSEQTADLVRAVRWEGERLSKRQVFQMSAGLTIMAGLLLLTVVGFGGCQFLWLCLRGMMPVAR